jgi:proline iminopeptidase
MPHAATKDNVKLYYEEAGSGTPILFIHEFSGDIRSWEPQVRYFARSHRAIAYCARGYTPSDVPKDVKSYSYQHWISDAIAVLDHLKIDKAHIVGLSMGGYTAALIGVHHPQRALSLTIAGCGSGSERAHIEEFRKNAHETAEMFEKQGSAAVAEVYGMNAPRIPFLIKDPRGYQEFFNQFASHDPVGSANTLRGFQAVRPSIYDFEKELRGIRVPTLIMTGDEDEPCVEPSVFLKQWIPTSGLVVFPKSGHVINIEEPGLFNQSVADFLARVEAGRWPVRDPRSYRK